MKTSVTGLILFNNTFTLTLSLTWSAILNGEVFGGNLNRNCSNSISDVEAACKDFWDK